MNLSTEQKIVIINICKAQLESLDRIEENIYELYNELEEEGYEVTLEDIHKPLGEIRRMWLRVRGEPDEFYRRLDEVNFGILRYLLFQDRDTEPQFKKMWKKLNLIEEVNQNLN